ncbi:FAD-dependent oxidoreductase [Antrihabitans sp. YC3-6]|uniref:FAD-dependent oxidoreductase n=1 Tax=Antrihabitans stalagmiti TaxID=2799499 RepID=A0A934NMB3_9NOCA|nr:FAD-dependent oxidoreductase [Antrihabitans stalagmiti]MBJ8337851.1 FAD-dependent oxidoreductase [Antrihabitans stalagmiti]
MTDSSRLSRRAFVGGVAALGAATLLPQADAAPMRSSGKRVAVFGGGMSGLTAAHELVERGFRVDVFDSRDRLGGKARSFGVPGSRAGGPAELPAEHGFRFFPGFYRNVPESMRRIPLPGGGSVVDNLRGLDELAGKDGFGGALSLGTGQSSAGFVPLNFRKLAPVDPGRLTDLTYLAESFTQAFRIVLGIPLDRYPLEMADFTRCVLVYLTSCLERRQSQWDSVSWWNFLDADNKSAFFRNAVVKATTMDLVAVKPEVCSVYSAGNIVEAFLWNVLAPRPGPDDAFALRFLDGPTSESWIDPWTALLAERGVRFHHGHALRSLTTADGAIGGATVVDRSGAATNVDADHYISAIPLDRAKAMLRTAELLALDPTLDGIADLRDDWMNGMQIYLRRPLDVVRGIVGTLDHPWTLSAVTQSTLWTRSIPRSFGDGSVNEVVSVDISTWDAAGTTAVRKPARECTREEVFTEVWETLKVRFAALDPAMRDDNVHSWFLDPAISWRDGTVRNDEPLSVFTVDTRSKRPKGPTAIRNLFVCGDWTQTNANVGCMEGANESGRIAAQAVLDAESSNAERVTRFDYYVPSAMNAAQELDAQRFAQGQPNLLDL